MTNSNGLERFAFPDTGQQIRVVRCGDEPWFVAADVCAVLAIGNSRQAVSYLDEDETGVITNDTSRGRRQMQIVSESGLYSLILRSRKPEARVFKRWITHEVLPQIRRTGSYTAAPTLVPAQMPNHVEALRGWADEVERREAAEQRVAELEPEAARAAQTIDADGLALVGTVAKRFGVKESFLREFLRAEGLLCSYGAKRNEPMARYVASGHFEVKVRVVGDPPVQRTTTYVTAKGEALIWERLFAKGLVAGPRPTTHQLALEGLQ